MRHVVALPLLIVLLASCARASASGDAADPLFEANLTLDASPDTRACVRARSAGACFADAFARCFAADAALSPAHVAVVVVGAALPFGATSLDTASRVGVRFVLVPASGRSATVASATSALLADAARGACSAFGLGDRFDRVLSAAERARDVAAARLAEVAPAENVVGIVISFFVAAVPCAAISLAVLRRHCKVVASRREFRRMMREVHGRGGRGSARAADDDATSSSSSSSSDGEDSARRGGGAAPIDENAAPATEMAQRDVPTDARFADI
jgi:hypothetical protein